MKKFKYYAVRTGRRPGIYGTWAECEENVRRFKGAIFKSFTNFEDAKRFMKMGTGKVSFVEGEPVAIATVDGSYSDELKTYSYGIVMEYPSGERSEFSGIGTDVELLSSRNIAGETLAVMKAVKFAHDKGCKNLLIRYDYQGIESWVSCDWGAKSLVSMRYVEYMESFKKLINIKFEKVTAHSGDLRNERADELASQALDKLNPYYMELDEL